MNRARGTLQGRFVSRHVPSAIALVLALVIVATLLSLKLAAHSGVGAGTSATSGRPQSATMGACRLPVVVEFLGMPSVPAGHVAGFVSLSTLSFSADASASVSGMPHEAGQKASPVYFSPALNRWLPQGPPSVSPDGMEYVYTAPIPSGATLSKATADELHIYDVQTGSDVVLWSVSGSSLSVVAWQLTTVVVQVLPLGGGTASFWLVDSVHGGAVPSTNTTNPLAQPPPNGATVSGWSVTEVDSSGDYLYWERPSDDVAGYEVLLVNADGQSATLFSGRSFGTNGPDPFEALLVTADSVWFPDFNGQDLWSWTSTSGVASYAVNALPGFSAEYPSTGFAHTHRLVRPAGPCLPN